MVLPMACSDTSGTVASLMLRLRSGDREAADQLLIALYREVRRLAAAKMSAEASDDSWQPSLLVNELYLQLIKVKSLPVPGNSTRNHNEDEISRSRQWSRDTYIVDSECITKGSARSNLKRRDFGRAVLETNKNARQPESPR